MAIVPLPRVPGIYCITCIPTGKIYIGSSNDLRRRHSDHCWQLNAGKHANPHLQNAWRCYGADAFCFDILEYVAIEQLIEREQFYLDTLRPWNKNIGFNVSICADSATRGRKASPETLAKLRAKRHSAETKARMSAVKKGKPVSEETRRIKSANQKGKPVPRLHTPEARAKGAATRRGVKQSAETIQKRVNSNRGYKATPETKKRQSEIMKARFQKPGERERNGAASRGRVQSPAARLKNAESQRRRQAKLRAERQDTLPLVQLPLDLD
jgi:group I intron endonuclease